MAEDNGLSIDWTPSGRSGTATLTARLGGEVLAVESVNMSKPKARTAFADAICDRRSGIDRKEVKNELLRLAADVVGKAHGDPQADAGNGGRPHTAELLAKMPEGVRTQAHVMLEAPELLKRVVDDIGLLGVAGERELAATIYMVGTSRLLTQPLAAIVQGPSSSGKSYIIEKAATLFPPEAVVHATQMTPQALFHMKPGSLEHRFVVAGERSRLENDERAEATRALREMLSSGRLTKLMPIKVGGEIQTVSIEQAGPIAFVESTTLAKIFDEDANRCILLTTDERQDQTRRIITRLAADYGGALSEAEAEQAISRHHALQRMLQPSFVVVPFAERLGGLVAHDRVESRRAFPQLMSMIQASALLHQRQRKIDDHGRLLADADDYRLARHLLAKPMARLLGGRLSDPAQRFYDRLRQWFDPGETFTSRDAVKRESASKSSVYGWLSELHDAGLVDQVEAHGGRRPATWRLASEQGAGDSAGTLPAIDELFE